MLSHVASISPIATPRSPLAVYSPPSPEAEIAHWRINGHPASILIWTVEEWERLTERPRDAQHYPCGVWCALRVD